MTNKFRSLLLVATLLSGCTMIPEQSAPDFSAAAQWQTVTGYATPTGDEYATALNWKEFFNDPSLQQVIGLALEHNKDLKTAALNIDAARATYRITRADLLPNLNINGEGTLTGSSDESSSTGRAATNKTYEANAGISAYELDLFGKLRSNNASALNDYLATEEAYQVVRQALIAEVANAYLQYLADQKLLSLTEKTQEAQQSTYDLLSESLKKGVSTEQDVARAATAVETARVTLHQYRRYVAQDKNALFLLLGIPQDDARLPALTLEQVRLKDTLDPGIPSEVLLLRPDVRQAEYTLLARNADIGAARAAFFPSISLTSTYGFASQDLSNLFVSGAAGVWSFLPTITLPIFQGGRNKANLDLAKVRKEQAVIAYEKAIQTAFREVADELAARATYDEQLKAQHRLVEAAQKVYDISEARYKSGIDSFLSVLDSQRELYTYQQNEILIEQQRLSNLVTLYKVLGGGTMKQDNS